VTADTNQEPLSAGAADTQKETVEDIAEDLRPEIRLGHVEDNVTHVLEEQRDEAGAHPEAVMVENIRTLQADPFLTP
jgi:hypothetical protein